ncbi:hypothetical protein Trydic_g11822 [Trypoxylus dichotomus]
MKDDDSIEDDDVAPSNQFLDDNGIFSGLNFVQYLQEEGSKVPYDYNKPERGQLPPYYDEIKFKKAQDVFKEYACNLLFVKLAGLVTLLVDESAVRIMILTNRSSTPEKACQRYKDTIKHVITWYVSDLHDGSALWQSICRVKMMHRGANAQAGKVPGMPQITQLELAGTVFGFIGYAVTRPQSFGLDSLTNTELEALMHFWRVIGYMLGVDDKFNICRESSEETIAIFDALLSTCFKQHMLMKDPSCLQMQFAAIEGISMLGLPIRPKPFLNFTYGLICWDETVDPSLAVEVKGYGYIYSTAENKRLNGLSLSMSKDRETLEEEKDGEDAGTGSCEGSPKEAIRIMKGVRAS